MPDGPPSRDRWLWVLGGLYLLFFLAQTPLGLPVFPFDVHDEGGKYAYLPSVLFDRDLDFYNQVKGYNQAFTLTPTGLSRADWSIGPALLWGPFFLLGHVVALMAHAADPGITLDGYSAPYYLLSCLGTLCYGWLGLLLLYSLLSGLYGRPIGACAAALAFFSSLVPYYTFARPLHDHGLSAFAVSACLWSCYRLASAPSEIPRWALLGLATGMVAAIRVNDVFFLLPVAIAAIPLLRRLPWKVGLTGVLAFLLFFLLLYGPQLLANRIIWGAWIGTKEDTDLGINLLAKSDWVHGLLDPARWRAILIGRRYGIFLQMPFAMMGLWGLGLRFRKDPFPTLGWLSYLAMLMAGMLIWSELIPTGDYWGENYGYRYTCSAVPILALGLAETLRSWRVPARWAWALAAFLIAWQASQLAQIGFCRRYDSPDWTVRAALELPALLRKWGGLLYLSRKAFLGILISGQKVGPLGILLHLAAPAVLLAGFIALTGHFRTRLACMRRLCLGLGVLLVLPFLWVEAWHPRKSPQEIYVALLSRVVGSMTHPFGSEEGQLIERGRKMAAALGEDPSALDVLDGYAQVRLGRTEEAERLWKGAVERKGDIPLAILGLARLETLRGNPEVAAAYLARVSSRPGHAACLDLSDRLSVDERGKKQGW